MSCTLIKRLIKFTEFSNQEECFGLVLRVQCAPSKGRFEDLPCLDGTQIP